MLPPRTKCPPTEPRKKVDPRTAKRGQFMGKATKYKNYLKGLKAATAGGGKGSGTGGSEFIKRRMKLADPEKTTNLGNPRKKGAPFLERRITLSGAGSALGRAAKASKYGKIALGIAGAGIAAHQYLKSKMKKNKDGTPKKKMGGGMMNKPIMAREGRLAAYARKKGLPLPLLKKGVKEVGKFPFIKGIGKKDISKKMGGGMMKRYTKGGGADMGIQKDKDRLTERDIKNAERAIQSAKAKRAAQGFLPSDPRGKALNMSKRIIDTLKSSKKMGGGMMMRPRGYKIGTGKKPLETAMNEKRAEQTENVKRLTTQSDAYDPETRYIFGERRTRSGGLRVGKKTTDWSNLKEEAKKVKDKYPGMNVGVYTPKEAEYAGFTRRRRRGKPTRSTLANQAQQQSAMAKQQKMTIGGSVTVKTKIGKNFPTKTY